MLNQKFNVSKLVDNTINVVQDSNYEILFDESGILFFNLEKLTTLNISITIADHVEARIIYWSEGSSDMDINETYHASKGSFLNVIYGELSSGIIERTMTTNLYEGSEVLVEGATVANTVKNQKFIANHVEKYTTSNLNNYGIISDGGDYFLDVIGKIYKGSIGSKAHQDSKILTISENQVAKVVPQLLIDENDVEASHAATVGQIDELQLYYMQSRGLSEMESMALLMSGYLMPIARAIEDEALSDHVKALINSKVEEICYVQAK